MDRATEKAILETLTGKKETKKEPIVEQNQTNWIPILLTLLFLVAFAGTLGWMYNNREQMYADANWNAAIELELCGEKVDLPCNVPLKTFREQEYCGELPIFHLNDNTMHIQGQVKQKEDITLGKFFDAIKVPFESNKIMNYTNGDLCPNGQPGTVKMQVNGQPREDYREYIPSAVQDPRKQVIKITFNSENS